MAEQPDAEPPSSARLLAAGQRGEVLAVTPVYGSSVAANVPGKGRGLFVAKSVPAGSVLLCEPALASAASHAELAEELCGLVEAPDDVLLGQLLGLAAWGETPTAVPAVADGEAESLFVRREPARDAERRASARKLLLGEALPDADDAASAEFRNKLRDRLELVARANAFRSAVDPLGALAWHGLAPREQAALAEQEPGKVPCSRLFLFLRASLINHCEAPNASWLVAGGAIVVLASEAIQKGREVLLSYWPDVDADDAQARGLLEGFGMDRASVGPAPELELQEDQRQQLLALKRMPLEAARRLAAAGAPGSDAAVVFDEAAAALTAELAAVERTLPKELRAFLEPRFFQAQLTLQQGAVLAARGEAARGEQLRQLGLARMAAALSRYPGPWGKRVLLRIVFALKGALRPAPVAFLEQSEGSDFAIQLAKPARATAAELQDGLGRAVRETFGDAALTPAVLSKCGVA